MIEEENAWAGFTLLLLCGWLLFMGWLPAAFLCFLMGVVVLLDGMWPME